ncbi:MAG: hypothetical protein CMN30_24455 [Sandaracinus sp.]|nr:hypothetical protein [Sandaracinus sp.]|tara:strand:- start:42 stop:809 length:768 start_codon:yes stop_codon:yes gene_type:complete
MKEKRSSFPRMLADLTYEEADTLKEAGAVALLPIGATEAHGPHLPLATDVIISVHAAKVAVTRLRAEGVASVVLPPVAYAVTEFAASFGGTISIRSETARALMRDVMVGAHRAGFRAVVVCNAHLEPGNLGAIEGAIADAREAGVPCAFPNVTRKPHALRLGDEFRSGACHAGSYETSLVMAATPFLVKREVQQGLPANPSSLSVAIREGKGSFEEAGGPRAYFGYPAEASEAEGHRLYEVLADIFAAEARQLLA